ncbi:MAG: hypothetical protein AB2693_30870, partial [Candidatus Thiodiazotropha sp.]
MINEYHIIGIQETKLDDVDYVEIDGFKIFSQNRKSYSRHRSGGITLLIKDEISHHVKVLKSDSKLALWFTVSKELMLNKEDLYGAVIYIPPYKSKFSHPDPYLELQSEIDKFCQSNKNLLLFGDLNSRSASLPDYIECDQFLCDLYGNFDLFRECTEISDCFEKFNVPVQRNVIDNVTNAYGYQLADLKKNNNIFILNGRINPDRSEPKLTCKDSSMVDYFLSSACMFEFVNSLEILEFNSLFSDVHCPISVAINIRGVSTNTYKGQSSHDDVPKIKLWDESKKEDFVHYIDQSEILKINEFLDTLAKNEITSDDINLVISDIENLFSSTSEKSFGCKKRNTQSNTHMQNKPWFNYECRNARNSYHKARKLYNKYKTLHYKNVLKLVSKNYKNTISLSVRKFKQNRLIKLKELRSNNPKDYWKIINSIDKKKNPAVSVENFYSFFKDINSDKSNTEDSTEYDPEKMQTINQEINQPISPEEILLAIRCLKNNKSHGSDKIINEQLKCSSQLMLPIYVKLFNIIFDKGIIPDSWALGEILPIYKNKGNPKLAENYRPITLLSCFGKVFTSILNNRLNKYAESYELINSCQAGFRKGYSTVDNLFVIQSLID